MFNSGLTMLAGILGRTHGTLRRCNVSAELLPYSGQSCEHTLHSAHSGIRTEREAGRFLMNPAHANPARKMLSSSLAVTMVAAGLLLTPAAHAQTAPADQSQEATLQGLWLTTPYPIFFAQKGEDVNIDLSLANQGLPPQRVEFAVSGLPDGWQWEINGGGKRIGAAIAASDKSVDLSLKLTPSSGKAGETYN